jgi:hypothetical protein
MGNIPQAGNSTQLVFCRENVDPAEVSRLLGLTPSEAMRVGEPLAYGNGYTSSSHLGIWKFELPGSCATDSIEDQIGQWLVLLEPRNLAFNQLHEMGYRPYLDCRAGEGSRSLCVDPEVLGRLGGLNIALSVWLYEESAVNAV